MSTESDNISYAGITLRVVDLKRSSLFWKRIVGLKEKTSSERSAELKIGGASYLRLGATASKPRLPKRVGLYHVAIHVADGEEFARIATRLHVNGYPHSATDHLVTRSIYLADPDGNGIEIAHETRWRGTFEPDGDGFKVLATDGSEHSGMAPLDLEEVRGELLSVDDVNRPLFEEARIGHIHLHVADLDHAMNFYQLIGFVPRLKAKKFGMYDARTNLHPHVIAFNNWASNEFDPIQSERAGLDQIEIGVSSSRELKDIGDRLQVAGFESTLSEEASLRTVDTDQNSILITVNPSCSTDPAVTA